MELYSSSATIFFFRAGFMMTEPGLLCAILFFCFLSSASVIVRRRLAACMAHSTAWRSIGRHDACTLTSRIVSTEQLSAAGSHHCLLQLAEHLCAAEDAFIMIVNGTLTGQAKETIGLHQVKIKGKGSSKELALYRGVGKWRWRWMRLTSGRC